MVLGSSPVIAVIAVKSLGAAEEFYGGTLGLSAGDREPGGVLYDCGGGTKVLVYESGYAATNQATAASWEVDDLAGAISELEGRGVSFERYDDLPGERDGAIHRIGNVAAAWFKDPDGNILNLVNRS